MHQVGTLYQEGKESNICLQQDKLMEIVAFTGEVKANIKNIKSNVSVIFKELKDLKNGIESLKIEVNTVKTKFGIYGALIGGFVGSVVSIIASIVISKINQGGM